MNPFKPALAVALCIAIPFALAACGGGGSKVAKIIPHQHWTYTDGTPYIELKRGQIHDYYCLVLQENVSTEKHSSRSKHNPDYTADTFVVTSKSKHYPANPGDKLCYGLVIEGRTPSFAQTKDNEFILQLTWSESDRYGGTAQINYTLLENLILQSAAVLGRYGNFKYGVFDNTEERTQEAESQVTGSTS